MRKIQDYEYCDTQEEEFDFEDAPKRTPKMCKECGYQTKSYCEKFQNWCKFAKEECISY